MSGPQGPARIIATKRKEADNPFSFHDREELQPAFAKISNKTGLARDAV